MKNRRGSTFILTLMVFAFLSILATATMGFMVSENNQSIAHENKIEAYYIARSGAEAVESAIISIYQEEENLLKQLKEDKDNIDLKNKLENIRKEIKSLNDKLKLEEVKVDEISIGSGGAKVTLSKDGNKEYTFNIESIGKAGNSSESVTKVLNFDKDLNSTGSTSKDLIFKYPVYAFNNIIINEDIKINSVKNKLVYGGEFKFDYNSNYKGKYEKNSKELEDMKYLIHLKEPLIKDLNIEKGSVKIDGSNYKIIRANELQGKLGSGLNYYIDGDVELNKVNGIINSNIYVNGNITINSEGPIKITGRIMAKGDIEISAKNEVSIELQIGDYISSGGDIKIKSGDVLYINGDINSQGSISVEAGGNININNADTKMMSEKEIDLYAKGTDVSMNGNIFSNSNIILRHNSFGETKIEGVIYTPYSDIKVTADNLKIRGGNAYPGSMMSNNLNLENVKNITIGSFNNTKIKVPIKTTIESIKHKSGYYK